LIKKLKIKARAPQTLLTADELEDVLAAKIAEEETAVDETGSAEAR
jgi:hypothetical protein